MVFHRSIMALKFTLAAFAVLAFLSPGLSAQEDEAAAEEAAISSEAEPEVEEQEQEQTQLQRQPEPRRQPERQAPSGGSIQSGAGIHSGAAIVATKPSAGGAQEEEGQAASSCPPPPSRVRNYKLADYNFGGQCGGGACDQAVQLRHYRYPLVVRVQEMADFMERCDFRADTPCPLSSSNYPTAAESGSVSVFTQVAVGASIPESPGAGVPAGVSVSAAPFIGISRSNRAFDMSVPFEIDPRMAGRTYIFNYTKNTNNPSHVQISVSECEGDFSRSAVHVVTGHDIPNYLIYASRGLEGSARMAKNTLVNQLALKAGKRYYLNLRELSGFKSPHAASDSLADREIFSNTLMRHFFRDPKGFSIEFYRLSFLAYPAGHQAGLTDAEFAASPDFRRPGQPFK